MTVLVICRIGSLEIDNLKSAEGFVVICRIGSLEMVKLVVEDKQEVICRIGSLENADVHGQWG